MKRVSWLLGCIVATYLLISAAFAGDGLQGQMDQEVQASIAEFEKADSLSSWTTSPLHPEAILARVLAHTEPDAKRALCKSLLKLPAERVGSFYEIFSNDDASEMLQCAPVLRRKFDRFLEERSRVLDTITPPAPVAKRVASLEVHIELDKKEHLYDAGLKPGEVAITVDDGPNPKHTQPILNAFAEYGVRATYFQVGQFAQLHPALTRAVVDGGHTLGTHSWSHQALEKLSLTSMPKAIAEIEKGIAAVSKAAGDIAIHFFRFPGGGHNAAIDKELWKRGQVSFLWNMDSGDWRMRDPVAVYQQTLRAFNATKNRGIIVFHDTHPWTAAAMPKVLAEMARRNITSVVFVPH